MKKIRKRLKYIAVFMALNLVLELAFPAAAYALSGGPSQPEVQSFEPIGTSEMVDIFSGDFTYNIPLMDVEGYPLNISYNSGITMDQEASWVGLGWNINPGVINRNMRGLPDDFDGDLIKRELNMKDNFTVGVTGSLSFELFGMDKLPLIKNASTNLSMSLGIKYNNYRGVGIEQSANLAVSASGPSQGSMTAGLGIKSSDEGLTISPSLSFSAKLTDADHGDKSIGGNVGCSYNSRAGLSQMSIGLSPNLFGKMNGVVGKLSGGNSSSLSFGTQTYSPSISNQMVNGTYTLNAKTGVTAFAQDATASVSGYFSSQRVANNFDQVPAYGYLNLHKGSRLKKVNLDFNREKDGGFSLNTPSLPLTNLTYDIYSVMGQGIGGSYRMFRSDMGSVYDSYAGNTNVSASMGAEFAVSGLIKGGIDVTITDVNTYTEKWVNPASNKLAFKNSNGNPLYEAAYFRESGEQSVDADPAFFEKMGGERPVRFDLRKSSDEYVAVDNFVNDYGQQQPVPQNNTRVNRQRRNQTITYMTRGEMRRFGLENQLEQTYNAPEHHIGQITALRPDGGRYIFGIAAYNHKQEETTFNVGKIDGGKQYPKGIATSGLIRYRNTDNSMHNSRGIDNYYSNQITPAYAHSYLLTSVLSADYVDIDGVRGPSPGDMGSFSVFHYTKVTEPYKWRTPIEQFEANFNEGFKSDIVDDKANYVYGEKELWYVANIETKNYVAVFSISDRDDAHGVKNKNGGISDVSMKKLDKISLYSRADYELNGSGATPIKEVHFEYDYELCPGVPNQTYPGQGKLTLKKIYFTYGNSFKAKFNAYEFEYNGQNPSYSLKSSDRWGYFKDNQASTFHYDDILSTSEYPYTEQNQTVADDNTSSWNMTDVFLPSGGKIHVTYESDDYAYVQNKRAMEMFKIEGAGFCEDPSNPPLNGLGNPIYPTESIGGSKYQDLYEGLDNRLYLFFKLETPLSTSQAPATYKEEIHQKYVNGIKDLYFRFLVNITNSTDINPFTEKYNDAYEYVSGYGEIEDYGVSPYGSGGSEYEYGFVKLKAAKRGDNALSFDCHPIAKAAWHYGRLNMPKFVYKQQDPTSSGIEQIMFALANSGLIKNLKEFALGANTNMFVQDYGKAFNRDKSWIRLNNPTMKKFGGGARVAKIEMSDEWSTMVSGNPSYSYGQEYDYTTIDESTGNTISSGVASYEPAIGGDENPFKLPVYNGNKEERLLAPDDHSYMEEPFGESFFPSPSIGYSKVTVKNLQYPGVTRNATGKVVHEFYTAKEFPTITRRTELKAEPYKTNPLVKLFTFKNKDFMSASQGFVVELNNMHGKQKRQMVYAEDQVDPISGVEYKYKSKPLGNGTYQLVSDVEVVNPDGKTATSTIGLDYDFVADMRSQESVTQSVEAEFNTASFVVLAFPVVVPTIFPGYTRDERRVKTATTTKVINRSAIVEETIAYDLGARVSTKNLAYDSETGDVLLTETINNFNEPVYSFSYPAHWYYDGMGQAYKNIGLTLSGISFNASGVSNAISGASEYFVPGDELSLNGSTKLWVSTVANSSITVITESGSLFDGTSIPAGTIKIMRSGRRNQQSLNIGSITSLSNPLDGLQDNKLSSILQANAIIYSEDWKTYCDCFNQPNTEMLFTSNPYLTGEKGVWRNSRSYLHLAGRTQSYENYNSNIRKDGVFTSFSPFWNWDGKKWSIQDEFWTWNTTITQFNPNGQEMENVDALDRYSAGLYAYNNTLTVGVGANMKLNEVAFDAFEDYTFIPCSQDHFSYRPYSSKVDENNSHTGKRSIKLNAGESITITKTTEPCAE